MIKLASIIIVIIISTSCVPTWEVSSISKGNSLMTRKITINKLPDKVKTRVVDCQPIAKDGKRINNKSIVIYKNKEFKKVIK